MKIVVPLPRTNHCAVLLDWIGVDKSLRPSRWHNMLRCRPDGSVVRRAALPEQSLPPNDALSDVLQRASLKSDHPDSDCKIIDLPAVFCHAAKIAIGPLQAEPSKPEQ